MLVILCVALATALTLLAIKIRRGCTLASLVRSPIFIIFAAGLAVRFICALVPATHTTDYGCFTSWANMLYENGLSAFYTSDAFTDYPPGYMYVLWFIGALKSIFAIEEGSFSNGLLLKLPAMLADLGTAMLIYIWAKKRTSPRASLQIAMAYCLNPAVILVSSIWGQVDSIHTLALLAAVYYLTEKRTLPSFALFSLACLIKPQSFMFTPLYMFFVFMALKESGFSRKVFLDLLECLFICLLGVLLLLLPFAPYAGGRFDFSPIIAQYVDTLGSYNYATVNAYNIFALFGQNWTAADTAILGPITYAHLGYASLVVIVAAALYLLYRARVRSNHFFVGAFICVCTFMFSIKMHERYIFPALALTLVAYVFSNDKRVKRLYLLLSLVTLVNCADVLAMTMNDYNYDQIKYTAIIYSVFTVLAFGYMIYTCVKSYAPEAVAGEASGTNGLDFFAQVRTEPRKMAITRSDKPAPYTKTDFIAICAITVLYGLVAFYNLGNTESPQSMLLGDEGDQAVVYFDGEYALSRAQSFLGPRNKKDFQLEFSTDGENWTEPLALEGDSVFSWEEHILDLDAAASMARITVLENELYMAEMAFRDAEGGLVPIASVSTGGEGLFDEQELAPEGRDYMNSTYFDEIYHPRTAYELVEGLNVYEWTHPPLGKVIMSWGVMLFGMTPFGWRFFGTFFGVLMLPLLYCFAKRMFKKSYWAIFATALFALDFMHFAQTRLATIDTYITFFVIGMYYFMYKYYKMSFYDTPLRKTLIPLFFSGLFMGLGIASKWPGVYAGLGLGLLFGVTIWRRWREHRFAKERGLQGEFGRFWELAGKTCAWCVLFFGVIPLIVYFLSYVPYYFDTGSLYPIRGNNPIFGEFPVLERLLPDNTVGNFIAAVLRNQQDMYNYHSDLESTHPYSSKWYQWILNWRPIYYFSNTVSEEENIRQGISAFGNPVLWWTGIVAFFGCVYAWLKKYGSTALFLIVAYLAQLLPWVLVSRTTYIYHYFPCVPFLALMVTYMFRARLPEAKHKYALICLGAAGLLFVMFYPILSGMPVNASYVKYVLEWLPRWHFI